MHADRVIMRLEAPPLSCSNDLEENVDTVPHTQYGRLCNYLRCIFLKFTISWKIYFRQNTLLAGLSLALICISVLCLDSITDVYAYSQGLQANIVALVRGCGALGGIVGGMLYPRLKTMLGLHRLGAGAFWFQLIFLILPMIAIWLPSSPFELVKSQSEQVSDLFYQNASSASNGTLDKYAMNQNETWEYDKTSVAILLTGAVISRGGKLHLLYLGNELTTQYLQFLRLSAGYLPVF